MDIKLIHKLDKEDVMPNALNHKEEYQGKMLWESIQILRTMFVKESNLERKIQEVFMEDCLAQNYFNDMRQKRRWEGSHF